QIAMSSMAASAIFHAIAGSVTRWPVAIAGSLAGVAADALINLFFVSLARALFEGEKARVARRYLFHDILKSAPAESILDYLGLALLALLFAAVYVDVGMWGLMASLVPVVLVRQSFV